MTPETVPGEFIVKIKGQFGDQHTSKVFKHMRGRAKSHHSMPGMNIHHIKMTGRSSRKVLMDELRLDPSVEYVEPNYVIHLSQTSETEAQILSGEQTQIMSSGGSATYSQDSAPVKVAQSWSSATSPNSVIVAVLDTGLDYNHYVMTSTSGVWTNSSEIPSNGIDDDGNGFIDDVHGWNFASSTNNPMDDNGHGTHVSGIVLGIGQNILAATLSTSKIKIMPLKFMDSSGTGTTAAAVSAIYYAIANGAKVINNSWGGSGYAQSLNDALTYAYNHGLFIASAAGNYASNDDSSPLYPANLSIPSQLSVAATDNYDVLASFSSYGRSTVHVAAPGVSILSLYPGNSFAYLSGTSMAAPFVAGLAAQVLREAPQLTGYQVRQIITQSVDVVSGLANYVSTSGRVNALTTVQNAISSVSSQSFQPVYMEVSPVDNTSRSPQSMGCGTISAGALSKIFWSRGGGSGGMGSDVLGSILALLLLPLFAWSVVRSRWVTPEGRRFERFHMNSEVKLLRDGEELLGRLSTISEGGVSFLADMNLSKGELITLQISDPGKSDSIQVMGRIVWNNNDQAYGVQFGPMADHLLMKIRQWTQQLVPT